MMEEGVVGYLGSPYPGRSRIRSLMVEMASMSMMLDDMLKPIPMDFQITPRPYLPGCMLVPCVHSVYKKKKMTPGQIRRRKAAKAARKARKKQRRCQ